MMLGIPAETRFDWRFHALGYPVRVHPFFWLVAVLLGINGGFTYALMVWLPCLFGSILVHELGHAMTARRYGSRHNEIILYGMGGLAVSAGVRHLRHRVTQLLMGPGAQVMLGGLVSLLWVLLPGAVLQRYLLLGEAMRDLLFINFGWALINLVPVYPLDGGQVVMEVLRERMGRFGAVRALRVSMYTAIAAAILVLLFMPHQFFIILLLAALAYQSHQMAQMVAMGYGDREPRQAWERDPDFWR